MDLPPEDLIEERAAAVKENLLRQNSPWSLKISEDEPYIIAMTVKTANLRVTNVIRGYSGKAIEFGTMRDAELAVDIGEKAVKSLLTMLRKGDQNGY